MPLCTLVTKRPVEFAIFELCNTRLSSSRIAPFVGGLLAGCAAAVMGCPFSVVKIQMQASGKELHATSFRAAIAVWKGAGFRGLYRGLKASVMMQVPFSTVYLGTYGKLREALPKTALGTAVAGGAASMLTWTCLQPLDTLRTVTQAGALRSDEPALGVIAQTRQIVRTRGVLGLWAGWVPVALRSIPTSAASMLAYEGARSLCSQ